MEGTKVKEEVPTSPPAPPTPRRHQHHHHLHSQQQQQQQQQQQLLTSIKQKQLSLQALLADGGQVECDVDFSALMAMQTNDDSPMADSEDAQLLERMVTWHIAPCTSGGSTSHTRISVHNSVVSSIGGSSSPHTSITSGSASYTTATSTSSSLATTSSGNNNHHHTSSSSGGSASSVSSNRTGIPGGLTLAGLSNLTSGEGPECQDNSALLGELAALISSNLSAGADMNTSPVAEAANSTTSNSNNNNSGSNKTDNSNKPTDNISIKTESGNQSNAVQQSHVSSSKPTFLHNDLLGSLLLKALNGFLFVVNSQGKIEFISENVTQFLKYSQEDLVGESIYNIIHVGDHPQFSNSLLPMTLTSGLAWPSESPTTRGCNFHCRMQIKPPTEEEEDVEVKQTYVSQYESMQITAILQPYSAQKLTDTQLCSPHSKENQTCLVCIARSLPMTEKSNMMIGGIDQFTTKQDLDGKIFGADTRAIANSHGIVQLEGAYMTDFCHVNDVQNVKKHAQEVLKNGTNTSGVYRFKLQENRYVFVQTKSQLFNNNVTGDPEFIMSTHSIIRECDSDVELKGSASTSLMKSIIGQSGSNRPSPSLGPLTSTLAPMLPISLGNTMLQSSMNSSTNVSASMNSLDTDLDMLAELDFLGLPNELNDVKPVLPSTLSGTVPNTSWSGMNSMKSPVSTGTPSPLQFALQGGNNMQQQQQQGQQGGGGATGGMKRPPMLNMVQRSNSVNSFDSSQKNPRFTPSPGGGGPKSAGFNQRGMMVGYPSQRSPGMSMGSGGATFQQNRGQGGQFGMGGYQRKTPVSPLMSPQGGFPSSPAGWGRSPASVPPTPPSAGGEYNHSLPHQSPLHALQSLDSAGPGSQMSGLDINVNSSSFASNSYMSSPSPSYTSSGGNMGDMTSQVMSSMAVTGSNNNGLNSNGSSTQQARKLCQLLTQSTTPEPLHSPASSDSRRPIGGRNRRVSGQIGSTMNPVSSSSMGPVMSTAAALVQSSGSILSSSSMDMPIHTSTASVSGSVGHLKSPDDQVDQSPTEGPGSSPPEKPQSTSNEDGDFEMGHPTSSSSSGANRSNNSGKSSASSSSGGANSAAGGSEMTDKNNLILKKLLSQAESDDEIPILDSRSGGEFNKNEAEPKKNNALLQCLIGGQDFQRLGANQLLGDQCKRQSDKNSMEENLRKELAEQKVSFSKFQGGVSSGATTSTSTTAAAASSGATAGGATKKRKLSSGRELLHKLLDNDDDEDDDMSNGRGITTSAPAESTSADLDVSGSAPRSRHQSEHQEPQSTSSNSDPSFQGSGSKGIIGLINEDMRPNKQLDDLLHSLWERDDFPKQSNLNPNAHQQQQIPSSSSNNSGGGGGNNPNNNNMNSGNMGGIATSNAATKNINNGNYSGATAGPATTKRRKMSLTDVDSSDGVGMETEPSTSTSTGPCSNLIRNNVLLTKLLSKRAQKETVVNTHRSINPMGVPQSRYRGSGNFVIVKTPQEGSPPKSSPGGMSVGGNSGASAMAGGGNNLSQMLGKGMNTGGIRSGPSTPTGKSGSNLPNFLYRESDQSGMLSSAGNEIMSADSQFRSLLEQGDSLFGENMVGDSVASFGSGDSELNQILQTAAELEDDLQRKGMGGGDAGGSGTSRDSAVDSSSGSGIPGGVSVGGGLNTPSSVMNSMGSMSAMSMSSTSMGTGMAMDTGHDSVMGGHPMSSSYSSVTSIAQALSSVSNSVLQTVGLNSQQQQQQGKLRMLASQKQQQQQQQQRLLQQQLLQQKLQQQQQQQQQKAQENASLSQPYLLSPQHPSSTTSLPPSSLATSSSLPTLPSSSMSSSSSTNHMSSQLDPSQQQQQSMSSELDVNDESNLVAQLEEIMKETGNWPSDNFLSIGSSNSVGRSSGASEQQAIDGIKRQLMRDEPLLPVQSQPQQQPQQMMPGGVDASSLMARQGLPRTIQQQLQGNMGQPPQQQAMSQMSMGQYSPTGQAGKQQAGLQNFNQAIRQQGPRAQQPQPGFNTPRGPLATALQSGVPFRPQGMNSSTMMVRHSILHQQRTRHKLQERDRQQRLLQLQQQQRMQGIPQQFNQRFPQASLPNLDGGVGPPQAPFPDLRELMTQGHPPNVTLTVPHNQSIPGPISPRFNPQQPSPGASQLSPHFSPQPGTVGPSWGLRPAGPADRSMQQGNQFSPNTLNRQRSLSGNSLPSPGNQQQQQQQGQQSRDGRFQFSDTGQFAGGGPTGPSGMFGQQSPGQGPAQGGASGQGMYQQGRMIQRMPTGRGSPRAPQSPFGTSPTDPLLISPQAVLSPGSGMRQGAVQVSPQYNQVPMPGGFQGGNNPKASMAGPAGFSGGPTVASGAPSSYSQGNMVASTANVLHDFDMQFLDGTLSGMDSKSSSDMVMSGGSAASQYVKQELRNICSARSEKQQQQQMQSMDFDTTSELPLEILETINDMSKEHGGPLSSPMEEENAVMQSREEAKQRLQQFRKLSTSTAAPVVDPGNEAEIKATSLFRNQLLQPMINTSSPSGGQMPQSSGQGMDGQVNILQSESRAPVDDLRPADNKNSLLCQLLSE